MVNSFDYAKLFSVINGKIKKDLNVTVTTESNIEIATKFPFITFNVVNPHKDQGWSRNEAPYFDIYVNYDAHSNNELESLTVGDRLRNWFKSENAHYELGELNAIDIVKISDNMVINNTLSIGYDFRNQFTVVLRVQDVSINDDQPTIGYVYTPKKEN